MDEAKWYVVHTYSGYENKVLTSLEAVIENRNLHDLIQEVTIPYQTSEEIKDGKQIIKKEMLFPSYVFVKMVILGICGYAIIAFLQNRKVKKVPLGEALKNAE